MHKLAIAAVAALLLMPAVSALEVATRGAFLQESDEYGPGAWDLGYYGCGVTIAVFDNGMDDKHPWLDGKVVAGVDTTDTSVIWTAANGGNPQPLLGTHGTPVGGMAASHYGMPFFAAEDKPDWPENARLGSAPCAWLVDVMFSDAPGSTNFEQAVIDAYDWAIENKDNDWGDDDPSNDGIEIITMSWSPNDKTDGTDPICEAANRAAAAGIVVLGSAGNSGRAEENTLGCPTGADGALSIANTWNKRTVTRDDDEITVSSSWGPRTDDGDDNPYDEMKPDVAAPGTSVVSTRASYADGTEYQAACLEPEDTLGQATPAHCTTYFGGTSAATPFVAGAVAVMLDANPELSPEDIREILHQTAEPFKGQEPTEPELNAKWHRQLGYGQLDALAAVKLALVWPGLELGSDMDSDGVRDYADVAPMNPSISDIQIPDDLQPVGGMVDSDGDGVVDQDDAMPLDPRVTQGQAGTDSVDTPLPLLIGVLGLLAGLMVTRRD